MECKKVIELLEKQSPKSYACDWDNVGLLVGREDKEIQRFILHWMLRMRRLKKRLPMERICC